jgi:hypothetical protein
MRGRIGASLASSAENDVGGRRLLSAFGAGGASAPPAVAAAMPPDPTTRTAPDTGHEFELRTQDSGLVVLCFRFQQRFATCPRRPCLSPTLRYGLRRERLCIAALFFRAFLDSE